MRIQYLRTFVISKSHEPNEIRYSMCTEYSMYSTVYSYSTVQYNLHTVTVVYSYVGICTSLMYRL